VADTSATPMSETQFLILFALRQERHGYGVMQVVRALTDGRIELGAGTVYSTLAKLDRAGLISATREVDRRKYSVITKLGSEALAREARRIADLYRFAEELL
jgi:DNA-binding PadR family transcriptional regulator